MLDRDVTVSLLRWFATNLGIDGSYLFLKDDDGLRDANMEKLLESFPEEDVMMAVHECIQTKSSGLIKKISYLTKSGMRERLGTDHVEFHFTWVPYPADACLGVVAIRRLISYQMLMTEYEYIKYMCETVGKGLGIFELDPVSGKSWLLFGTGEYSRLCTASIEELKQHGIPSVGRHVPEEDRRRAAKYMHQSMCSLSSWTISPRVFRDGAYRFTRFAGYCTSGDKGTVLSSVIAEDFSEHAREIEKANVEKSASGMLRSFLSAVFDVSFYLDNEYRILDDSTKLEHFLGTRPKGLLFNDLLLAADKARFNRFMTAQRNQHPENIASMVRLRLWTVGGTLIDVELFSSPNFVQSMTGLDYTSNVSTMCSLEAGLADERPTEFLIGLRVLSDVAKNSPKLVDGTLGYQDVLCGIRQSLACTTLSDNWIVPGTVRIPKNAATEMEECLVRMVSPQLQKRFRECVTMRDFFGCKQLLKESRLGWEGLIPRFFLHLSQSAHVEDARDILFMVDRARLCSDSHLLFEICLFGISFGLNQSTIDRELLDFLRGLFAQSLRVANSVDDIPEIHIIVYYICILWGCMNRRLGRSGEAVAVLEHVVADLKSYLIRYPGCTLGERLEYIARQNLAVELLHNGDIYGAIRLSNTADTAIDVLDPGNDFITCNGMDLKYPEQYNAF